MVDHLVLTSLDQLLFILNMLFTIDAKQAVLMRRSTVVSLSLQSVFPGCMLDPVVVLIYYTATSIHQLTHCRAYCLFSITVLIKFDIF
jgi:hypothetical protein